MTRTTTTTLALLALSVSLSIVGMMTNIVSIGLAGSAVAIATLALPDIPKLWARWFTKAPETVGPPPAPPAPDRSTIQGELYISDDKETLEHLRQFIIWQCSTLTHAMMCAVLRSEPVADVTGIPHLAMVKAMMIRRDCMGNRKVITGQDQLQIIEATIRWCAERVGIMERADDAAV